MKALRNGALTIVIVACGLSQAQSAHNESSGSAREKLIGAWHLAHIEAPGPDGKPMNLPQPKGMLIYTLDGHMSVQLMYPKSANALSNEYVQDGYEACLNVALDSTSEIRMVSTLGERYPSCGWRGSTL